MRWQHLLPLALLVACTSPGDSKPSAKRAAAAYLELHNDWDDEAARALWGTKTASSEQLTDWFHDQVGPCAGFSPMQVTNDLHARFVFDCQRGQLEIEFRVDETTGVVEGLKAGARGVEPPLHVGETAKQIVALANGEPATEPKLVGKLDSAEFRKELDEISARGPCRIDRVHLASFRGARLILECADGDMTMLVDLDRHGALRRFGADTGAADTWRNRG